MNSQNLKNSYKLDDAEKKYSKKDKRKRKAMKVNGAGVKRLSKIIKDK